ncbi:unnamed protein product [Ectocarpus sp. CCAP 1310/34]|nr:unnamed protein product [Ectocarpus sp. CCAP 1310/34]
MPVSTAVATPLHAALRTLHVAEFQLPLIARRASRRLVRACSSAARVSGVSHHSCVRRLRGSSPRVVRAALKRALVKSVANSATVVVRSSSRVSRVEEEPISHRTRCCFELQFPSVELLLFRFSPDCTVVGKPATEVDGGYYHIVV